jgi:hypothetical protein
MSGFAFPYGVASDGRTARTTVEARIRSMIELVLFTTPGERVNRPEFGSGARQLVFAGASPELATAVEFLVHGALQRWLGDLIQLERVDVEAFESTLSLTIGYRVLATDEAGTVTVSREV